MIDIEVQLTHVVVLHLIDKKYNNSSETLCWMGYRCEIVSTLHHQWPVTAESIAPDAPISGSAIRNARGEHASSDVLSKINDWPTLRQVAAAKLAVGTLPLYIARPIPTSFEVAPHAAPHAASVHVTAALSGTWLQRRTDGATDGLSCIDQAFAEAAGRLAML